MATERTNNLLPALGSSDALDAHDRPNNASVQVAPAGEGSDVLAPQALFSSSPTRGSLDFLSTVAMAPGGDNTDFDLVVIGAGSAAFAAAIRATEGGYRVALVEDGIIGGTCVNVGCVPSKALLRAAELAWEAGHHPFTGLRTTSHPVDLATLVARKNELVDSLRQHKYQDLLADYGITLIRGRGRFKDPSTLDVNGESVSAQRFLVATGAVPTKPPIPGLSESGFLTSDTALNLTQVPKRLAVIGANSIGLELGQFFIHVGSIVTFIDIADRIAYLEEPEVSRALCEILTDQGATIHTSSEVLEVYSQDGAKVLKVSVAGHDVLIESDEILLATGRLPDTADLDLHLAKVKIDSRGAIVVNEQLCTSNPIVFAAGDVTGGPQFVYVAAYEGTLAVDNALFGQSKSLDLRALPKVTFTAPQLASVGITEEQARSLGIDVEISVLSLEAVPRALVNRDTRGIAKLVADAATGKLLGASLLADGAGDVIEAAVLAIKYGITADELAGTFHPYLTMAESIKLAAQTFRRDVNRLSCCAP